MIHILFKEIKIFDNCLEYNSFFWRIKVFKLKGKLIGISSKFYLIIKKIKNSKYLNKIS
jgi:hypothetical protein